MLPRNVPLWQVDSEGDCTQDPGDSRKTFTSPLTDYKNSEKINKKNLDMGPGPERELFYQR